MKEITLICLYTLNKACQQLLLFHRNCLHENQYAFRIQFSGNLDKFTGFHLQLNTFNSNYTLLEIAVRFIYLICSMIVTCLFLKSIRRFSISDWSLEQRWMVVLLISLVLYNNPVYPLTFLAKNFVPLILDGLFQGTFLYALLLFWLSIYHGIRQNTRRFLSFYFPKILLISLLWVVSIVLSSARIIQAFRDPMYDLTIDMAQLTTIRMIFYLLAFGYILYLVFLILRAFGELQNMPYFDIRLKFTAIAMFSVVVIALLILTVRFSSAVMEENFVPEWASRYNNSAEFFSIYSLMNLYLYTMAFVYLPSKTADMDSLFHGNPTFSMINDSDEDVLYE